MPKIRVANPELNRLRATAGLIPIIESGLSDSKIDRDRAALMASFCQWAIEGSPGNDPEASKLADAVRNGLERVKVLLA